MDRPGEHVDPGGGVVGLVRPALAIVLVATVGACYEPELRDCTVSCSGPGECARGQVCGDDGWCAVPEVAGQCGEPAPVGSSLRVTITGQGRVKIPSLDQVCQAMTPAGTECTYAITPAMPLSMKAENAGGGYEFQGWATANCDGQGATCELAAAAGDNLVGARFTEGH